MKKRFIFVVTTALVLTGFTISSCSDDDDDYGKSLGSKTITVENVAVVKDFVQSGIFQMTGTEQPVILPGQSVSITFNAGKGQALMFATMYGFSNDIFFAPENPGIALFDANGNAITGDVSSKVKLWDNGTRINQAPGSGVNHPGTAEQGTVKMIEGSDEQGHNYSSASELMKLNLAYNPTTSMFTLTIENISGGKANETPFSPGVWAVSNKLGNGLVNEAPFFMPGQKSTTILTELAETGNNTPLKDWANERTGIMTGLSPVIVVVHSGEINPLFTLGEKDKGLGLKELAQTGSTNKLKESMEKTSNVKKVYVLGTSPIAPGQKVESMIEAFDGYNISFATMFGYSNDWFYANEMHIASGNNEDITDKIILLDSGTGVDQYPGAGNSQALFGGSPVAENNNISKVGNAYPVPEVSKVIKVTIR